MVNTHLEYIYIFAIHQSRNKRRMNPGIDFAHLFAAYVRAYWLRVEIDIDLHQ